MSLDNALVKLFDSWYFENNADYETAMEAAEHFYRLYCDLFDLYGSTLYDGYKLYNAWLADPEKM